MMRKKYFLLGIFLFAFLFLFMGCHSNLDKTGTQNQVSGSTDKGSQSQGSGSTSESTLYYIDIPNMSSAGGKLDAFGMKTGSRKTILSDVGQFVPSPDQKKALALLHGTSNTQLEITDLEGKTEQIISKQKGLQRSWWSPNQKYVAYSIVNDTSDAGLYVFNITLGASTKMESNTYGSTYSPVVSWSPSGDKIAMWTFNGSEVVSKLFYLSLSE